MEKFMKQKSKYILILIFIVIIIYLLFNYFIKNIEEDLMDPYIEYPTYTFSGRSEHFKFDTGKVYFTNKYSQILISDFSFILSYILLILTMHFICVKNRIMIFYNFRQRIHLFLPVFVTFRSF